MGGPLHQTQVNENFRVVRHHHRADICIIRGKITTSFSYMGHNIIFFWLFGGGGADRAHFASQLSSHLYLSTYKIWKQSAKDFVSYRENDEVYADAAA